MISERITSHNRCCARALVLALLLVTLPAQGAQLGRLFTTPQQRATLNQLRAEYDPNKKPEAPKKVAEPRVAPRPSVEQVTVNGLVLRSSGNNMSWVNGAGIPGGNVTREGLRIIPTPADGGGVRIELPGDYFAPIDLKAGQKMDVLRGQILDAYEHPDTSEEAGNLFKAGPQADAEAAPDATTMAQPIENATAEPSTDSTVTTPASSGQ